MIKSFAGTVVGTFKVAYSKYHATLLASPAACVEVTCVLGWYSGHLPLPARPQGREDCLLLRTALACDILGILLNLMFWTFMISFAFLKQIYMEAHLEWLMRENTVYFRLVCSSLQFTLLQFKWSQPKHVPILQHFASILTEFLWTHLFIPLFVYSPRHSRLLHCLVKQAAESATAE